MSKPFFLTLMAALTLAVAGCATTGDPNAGGLWGWSEAKAQQRQAEARATLEQEERRGDELKAEKQRLQNQINAKKKELEAKNRELEALKKKRSTSGRSNDSKPSAATEKPGDSKASAATEAEISRLEAERAQLLDGIRNLELSIGKLSII